MEQNQQTADRTDQTDQEENSQGTTESIERFDFFASKGAQINMMSSALAIIPAVGAMLYLQKYPPFLIIIAFFAFSIFRARRRLVWPVMEIDQKQKTLATGKLKLAFKDIQTWSIYQDELILTLRSTPTQSENESGQKQLMRISLKLFDDGAKYELSSTLKQVFGEPNEPIERYCE